MVSLATQAQTTVTGTVTDGETQTPLPGVNVIGGTQGVITDFDGNYELTFPSEIEVLEFSSLGFATQSVNINGRSSINVILDPQSEALDEVVIVGYGTVKKSDLTGSVSSIDGDAFKELPVTSVDQAIQARSFGCTSYPNLRCSWWRCFCSHTRLQFYQ